MTWIDTGCNDDLTYASLELRKYYKDLTRLQMQKGISGRQFFDNVGKFSFYQICVRKHLRKEAVYRIHSSPTGGHLGIVRTAKEFRQRFYFSRIHRVPLRLHQNLSVMFIPEKSFQKTIKSTLAASIIRATFPW